MENTNTNSNKSNTSFYIFNVALFLGSVLLAVFSYNMLFGVTYIVIGVAVALLVIAVVFTAKKKELFKKLSNTTIARLTFIVAIVLTFLMCVVFFFYKIGIFEVTDSVEEMRDYIRKFGYAKWTFIFIQFIQVIFLPIPTTITLLAGLLLFKPWEVVLYSLIGIIPGSIIMFFFGKYAGRKAVNWALGEEEVEKYLNLIKGKDVSLLTVMFLMPLFPDDTLCMIAGLSTMRFRYFLPVIVITRVIMCVSNVFIFGNGLIPFSGWGIPIWIAIVAVVIGLLVIMWKKGDVVQEKLTNFFEKIRLGKKDKHKDKSNIK